MVKVRFKQINFFENHERLNISESKSSDTEKGAKEIAMIKVYGANWCGDTQRTRAYLDDLGINYDYIDLDAGDASASEWVKSQNEEGKEKKPTLLVGTSVLVVPDENRLRTALEQEGLIDKS